MVIYIYTTIANIRFMDSDKGLQKVYNVQKENCAGQNGTSIKRAASAEFHDCVHSPTNCYVHSIVSHTCVTKLTSGLCHQNTVVRGPLWGAVAGVPEQRSLPLVGLILLVYLHTGHQATDHQPTAYDIMTSFGK